MKKILIASAIGLGSVSVSLASHTFITPVGVTSSTEADDLWGASNLIQGPGIGFNADDPHEKISGGAAGNWVTADPGGFPSDYIAVAGMPVLTFDLGADTDINEIFTWGYANGNTNGVSEFSLRFATDAEGTGGFGTSITFNPTYTMLQDESVLQETSFGQTVTARYVEFTAIDNFFVAPGNDPNNPGGDRVGLGEVSFGIPEPSSALLGLAALGGFALRRRRI